MDTRLLVNLLIAGLVFPFLSLLAFVALNFLL